MTAPLAGLKILDLSRILAGPYATQMLADLGADVVKVEPPEGDDTRKFGPPFVGGESTYFLSINRGKRSIVVDLKQAAGRAVVHDLATWADVAVENFRPGVADKLDVGWKALSAKNPRLVYASISGYGQRGLPEYVKLPGYDLVIQGVGGIPALTGPVEGPPFKMGTSVADMVSGLNACGGILAALWGRERSGQGAYLDVAMLDGQLSLLTYHASAWLNAQQRPQRLGNAHPSICPYETLVAADGFVNVACGNDAQFRLFAEALGHKDLATDPRFATNAARVSNRAALLERLEPIMKRETVAVWVERLAAAGVPCGPIADVPGAVDHPQAAARGLVVEHLHAKAGTVRTIGTPMGFAPSVHATTPPPLLGEHTDDVLSRTLGYDAGRIAELRASRAVA